MTFVSTGVPNPFGSAFDDLWNKVSSKAFPPEVLTQQAMDLMPKDEQIQIVFDQIKPVFQGFVDSLDKLSDITGLNTTAITSNTDAVLGPVQSFLMSLDTGPLAPTQSLASLSGWQEKLYTAAFADPSKFSEYASFMTSQYLPQMQGNAPDYAGVVSGVRGEVGAMPWVASSGIMAPTAIDIGAEVGKSVKNVIGPMLADIKDSAQFTVNITVDGQVIKTEIVKALDDPNVAAKARKRIRHGGAGMFS